MISYTRIKDQIKQNLNLKDIVEFYIGNNIGHNKRYKCPFNLDEEHYNLEVKGKKWHCYSCGESGDEIEFVKKLFNIPTYKETLIKIAEDFHLVTDCKYDSNIINNINKMKRDKEKKEKRKILLQKKEIELFNILKNKKSELEKKLNILAPYSNKNLSKYRYTYLAGEFIKTKKSLDNIEIYISILSNEEVDTQIYWQYNINMDDKNYKSKLAKQIVIKYFNL